MPLRLSDFAASNSAANEWWAMTPGVASTNPTTADKAAIFALMNVLQKGPAHAGTRHLCAAGVPLWELRSDMSTTPCALAHGVSVTTSSPARADAWRPDCWGRA